MGGRSPAPAPGSRSCLYLLVGAGEFVEREIGVGHGAVCDLARLQRADTAARGVEQGERPGGRLVDDDLAGAREAGLQAVPVGEHEGGVGGGGVGDADHGARTVAEGDGPGEGHGLRGGHGVPVRCTSSAVRLRPKPRSRFRRARPPRRARHPLPGAGQQETHRREACSCGGSPPVMPRAGDLPAFDMRMLAQMSGHHKGSVPAGAAATRAPAPPRPAARPRNRPRCRR